MKRVVAIMLLSLCVVLMFTGCNPEAKRKELIVFAASSMTESLSEIAQLYENENTDIRITFNFDSSGTLKTQIEEGADCDVFISASQKPMNSLNCIIDETRFDILENKIALVVPKDNPKSIYSFEDMVACLKESDMILAIGNADVPVGEYTLKIFEHYNLDEKELSNSGCLTYGSNAKEVTTQVNENMVDCGIVYQTDANAAKLTVVDTATESMCGQVVYPAAVVDTSTDIELSKSFLDYLKNEQSSQIFAKYGFTPLT